MSPDAARTHGEERPAVPEEARRRGADRLVSGVFVASGAAGLIYQVVWSRELVLVFGNTTEAIGTIVTAFMAGLGLGGLVGGLVSTRLRRPLLAYGLAELAVAASALLVPIGFHLISSVYSSAYDITAPEQMTFVRLVLTMAVVTPVTFLMGLTLPLITRHLVNSMRTAGARMGQLYSANTLGAMAGTLASGIVLIELLGLSTTADVAVALNMIAGAVAVFLAFWGPTDVFAALPQPEERAEPERQAQIPGLRRLLYATTFVSGFVALALEVLWTRMLAEGTGSLQYHFVAILAVYLFGIGLGGVIYRSVSSPSRDTPQVLAIVFLIIAAATFVTVPLGAIWYNPVYLFRVLILLPGTVCMGYAFPLTARLLTRDPAHSGRSIGVLYAWNTVGSIGGSLAATFVFAATLGTNQSILVLGAAEAAVALALLVAGTRMVGSGRRFARSLSFRVSPAAVALMVIPALLVATGSPISKTSTERWLDQHHLSYTHHEDRLSTVDAVGGTPQQKRLEVSGTAMTALSVDTKLMAYIPKLVRPNSSTFLNVCFGMGTTYRSALKQGYRTDAVDLSPSVPHQMPTFYSDANQYLHSPLGHIVTADGRNYVRLTSHKYDVISVDPPPPIQSAGTGVLYSQNFYADAHRTLNPGGVMLEWLYYGVNLDELKQQLHSFRSEFKYTTVLLSPLHGGLYMLGSDRPIGWDAATANRVMGNPQAMQDIGDAPDSGAIAGKPWPAILSSMRWMQNGDVDRFAGRAPLITDDHPRTEYFALRRWFASKSDQNVTEAQLRRLWPPRGTTS
ncbi:MAG: fused MFS/spermidine synthase [Candidatus Dormibacteraeota bacterium]|nr:fused MFS/spermidine synthase [Candidatus Dormibacteraeota bacterium]MBO0761454.1 fused MFS/spermidine synthase [Candidatus Dormibacteraeota bacterium]